MEKDKRINDLEKRVQNLKLKNQQLENFTVEITIKEREVKSVAPFEAHKSCVNKGFLELRPDTQNIKPLNAIIIKSFLTA